MPSRVGGVAAVLKSSVAIATASTVAIFAFVHEATGIGPPIPTPEAGVLPVSLGGWVALITGVFSVIAIVIHAWKNPSEQVALESDRKLLELEKRTDKQIALLVADMANAESSTEKRVALLRETDAAWDVRMRANETAIAIGGRDREYLRGSVDDMKRTLERIVTDNKEQNVAVLNALSKIAGGVRGMMPIDYNPRERDKER